MIIHKKFGQGEVINKTVNENGTYITVRFSGGKKSLMAIPESFESGVVEALGDLKEEVDKAIQLKKELQEKLALEKELQEKLALEKAKELESTTHNKVRSGRKPLGEVKVKGPIQIEYERYLEAAGYPVVGVSGNDSTVPAYSRAVEKVIENEGITWVDLKNNISNSELLKNMHIDNIKGCS